MQYGNIGNDIENIGKCETQEEAFRVFCSVSQRYGYDRVAYSLVTDHPTLGLPQQHGLATSYPEDWMKFYRQKRYETIDPVTLKVQAGSAPFFWSDVTNDTGTAPESQRLMYEATEAGLSDGIAFSLRGGPGEMVGLGLARNTTVQKTEKDFRVLADIHLLGTYFHETFRSMFLAPAITKLTQKEQDVLS